MKSHILRPLRFSKGFLLFESGTATVVINALTGFLGCALVLFALGDSLEVALGGALGGALGIAFFAGRIFSRLKRTSAN